MFIKFIKSSAETNENSQTKKLVKKVDLFNKKQENLEI